MPPPAPAPAPAPAVTAPPSLALLMLLFMVVLLVLLRVPLMVLLLILLAPVGTAVWEPRGGGGPGAGVVCAELREVPSTSLGTPRLAATLLFSCHSITLSFDRRYSFSVACNVSGDYPSPQYNATMLPYSVSIPAAKEL